MDGVARQRAEVRRHRFQAQYGGPRRQAIANVVVEGFALGLLEDQDGQLGRLGGPQRQVERDGGHGVIVAAGQACDPPVGARHAWPLQ